MLGGLDHSRISRESAAVDESLERLQNVVGDITPDGLVEAFHSRRTRIESVRAECDLVQRDHDKLATQRRELEAANLTLTGNVVTTAFDVTSLRGQLDAKAITGANADQQPQRQPACDGPAGAIPLVGQHSWQVLTEVAGLSQEVVETMRKTGAVAGPGGSIDLH